MSEDTSGSITAGSDEVPEVIRTLVGVLPEFTGEDLESQLQTYDAFLAILSPSIRPEIADLLRGAAAKAPTAEARERILASAAAVERGERAATPYDHAEAMRVYTENFRKENPLPILPATTDEPAEEYEQETTTPDPEDKEDEVSEDEEDDDGAYEKGDPDKERADIPIERRHPLILAKLDRIEAEMRRIGYWSENPPDLQAAVDRGEIKGYLDAPTFELWLQVLFLPKARKATLEDKLPKRSQVGEMARRQYDYMEINEDAAMLLRLLQEFDGMVEGVATGLY